MSDVLCFFIAVISFFILFITIPFAYIYKVERNHNRYPRSAKILLTFLSTILTISIVWPSTAWIVAPPKTIKIKKQLEIYEAEIDNKKIRYTIVPKNDSDGFHFMLIKPETTEMTYIKYNDRKALGLNLYFTCISETKEIQ